MTDAAYISVRYFLVVQILHSMRGLKKLEGKKIRTMLKLSIHRKTYTNSEMIRGLECDSRM
jgi:hypothetical protein